SKISSSISLCFEVIVTRSCRATFYNVAYTAIASAQEQEYRVCGLIASSFRVAERRGASDIVFRPRGIAPLAHQQCDCCHTNCSARGKQINGAVDPWRRVDGKTASDDPS